MRRNIFLLGTLFIIITILLLFVILIFQKRLNLILVSPLVKITPTPTVKILEKYAIANLKKREYVPSKITFGKVLNKQDNFTSLMFYYYSDGKRVSGMANIPNKPGTYPVIAMFRGFVDISIYETGIGTKHGGEYLSQKGFITLAPDFLGYGESASPSAVVMEERFETYTTAIDLLASIRNINTSLEEATNGDILADTDKIGIWGHSNGGHIALATLEITGNNYPTVLWAPVSKPFPYSILYFTDEFEDNGKALRKVVSDFEKDYDVENYSVNNYYKFIKAPLELHQGTDDEAVPERWSNDLYNTLKKTGVDITYFTYRGENHNFANGGWGQAINRSVQFYDKYLD
jgi:uncharacterized protein